MVTLSTYLLKYQDQTLFYKMLLKQQKLLLTLSFLPLKELNLHVLYVHQIWIQQIMIIVEQLFQLDLIIIHLNPNHGLDQFKLM